MPLLDRDFHLVTTKPLEHIDEGLQGGVALFVKPAVGEELVEGVLLSSELHDLKPLEQALCNEQLAVVFIVKVHLLSLAGDLNDAVIISAVQMLHLPHQVVSLCPKTVEHHLNVVAVGAVGGVLPLKSLDLLKHFLYAVVGVEQLLLNSLDHAHLALEVLRKLLIIKHESIALTLQNAEATDRVGSALVDVRYPQLGVLVFVTHPIQLHL